MDIKFVTSIPRVAPIRDEVTPMQQEHVNQGVSSQLPFKRHY